MTNHQSSIPPRLALLDVWMALGKNSTKFDAWMDDPKRTPADAWAQMLAVIRGGDLSGDTNPPPGTLTDADADVEWPWWTIYGAELMAALERAHAGDDPGVVYAELYANSDRHDYRQGTGTDD